MKIEQQKIEPYLVYQKNLPPLIQFIEGTKLVTDPVRLVTFLCGILSGRSEQIMQVLLGENIPNSTSKIDLTQSFKPHNPPNHQLKFSPRKIPSKKR